MPNVIYLDVVSVLDTAAGEQTSVAIQKLQQCQKIFDFYDPVAQLKSKEVCLVVIFFEQFSFQIKRAALNELIDYITASKGVIVEPLYPEIIRMVSRNIFRVLPPSDNSECKWCISNFSSAYISFS